MPGRFLARTCNFFGTFLRLPGNRSEPSAIAFKRISQRFQTLPLNPGLCFFAALLRLPLHQPGYNKQTNKHEQLNTETNKKVALKASIPPSYSRHLEFCLTFSIYLRSLSLTKSHNIKPRQKHSILAQRYINVPLHQSLCSYRRVYLRLFVTVMSTCTRPAYVHLHMHTARLSCLCPEACVCLFSVFLFFVFCNLDDCIFKPNDMGMQLSFVYQRNNDNLSK